jgi:hypothetical protein
MLVYQRVRTTYLPTLSQLLSFAEPQRLFRWSPKDLLQRAKDLELLELTGDLALEAEDVEGLEAPRFGEDGDPGV